jgi:hypothetical protein
MAISLGRETSPLTIKGDSLIPFISRRVESLT